VLEHEDVEEILKLLDATPVEQFELETGRFRIILNRTAGGWTQECQTRPDAGRPDTHRSVERTAATPAAIDAFKVGAAGADVPGIRAPLVGTYYRAPKPGAPPFVDVGSLVGPDVIVGIIETMKLMTSIYAGQSGRIDAIVVADGELVEQNQMLMTIVPVRT
jgi:acetyl-CoA carboxylase biotin carboxyl carrier protein